MKALIQRVREASVSVEGLVIGQISRGMLVFVGVDTGDDDKAVAWMVNKLLNYRIFEDDNRRMNKSIQAVGGDLLLVSQFTLSADTNSGMRPSFSTAASPDAAEQLFDKLVEGCKKEGAKVATGRFAADMQVSLVNDGPVTFLLESP